MILSALLELEPSMVITRKLSISTYWLWINQFPRTPINEYHN